MAGRAPVKLAEVKLVKFAPDNAGNVTGNLASRIVPEVRFDASSAVVPPIPVNPDPSQQNSLQ